jgi:hypothetical protein
MQFSSGYDVTEPPLGCNGAAVAKWRKSPFLPFCLNILYIAVIQRFTERPHILPLRKQKIFISEFLNFNGGYCQNFSV